MITIPGRTHIARVRDHHVRRWVCDHRGLCYGFAVLFILIMLVL